MRPLEKAFQIIEEGNADPKRNWRRITYLRVVSIDVLCRTSISETEDDNSYQNRDCSSPILDHHDNPVAGCQVHG